jgi:hypothetical protein
VTLEIDVRRARFSSSISSSGLAHYEINFNSTIPLCVLPPTRLCQRDATINGEKKVLFLIFGAYHPRPLEAKQVLSFFNWHHRSSPKIKKKDSEANAAHNHIRAIILSLTGSGPMQKVKFSVEKEEGSASFSRSGWELVPGSESG